MRFSRTKLLDRSVQTRDARIFLVATEGERTEPLYFRGLQEREVINRSRVKIEVVPTTGGSSAPRHVIARLDELARLYSLATFDECWLVIDYDRWGEAAVSQLFTQALQKGYRVALSRPCFELWLILHLTAEHALPPSCSSQDAKARWGQLNPGLDGVLTRELVEFAASRARALETEEELEHRWPQALGTRVFALAESLLAHGR